MSRASALDELCSLLRGEALLRPNWTSIIDVANWALVTPRLEPLLVRACAPTDLVEFVGEVSRRNRLRNERLYVQLEDAASALNKVGLKPMVFKGAACLVRSEGRCSRMISDIDLVVPPVRVKQAVDALQSAGFAVMEQYGRQDHAVAVLGRAQDPGQIDLHQRPPGPPVLFRTLDFESLSELRDVGSGRVWTPFPHVDIYLQILHDQFHDGGFWKGGFDLRHAWDVADLISDGTLTDMRQILSLPSTELSLQAVAVHLQMCHLLTGAKIPPDLRSWSARVQAQRQRLQYDIPGLKIPLAALSILIESRRLVQHRRYMRHPATESEFEPGYHTAFQSFKHLLEILGIRGARFS